MNRLLPRWFRNKMLPTYIIKVESRPKKRYFSNDLVFLTFSRIFLAFTEKGPCFSVRTSITKNTYFFKWNFQKWTISCHFILKTKYVTKIQKWIQILLKVNRICTRYNRVRKQNKVCGNPELVRGRNFWRPSTPLQTPLKTSSRAFGDL